WVYALLEEGYPSRYVVNKENISQLTVIRIKQCKDKTGPFKNQPKSGHPRLITDHIERNVI
ncbi:2983_t:CDS:1, partial [Diversispora eburnea]